MDMNDAKRNGDDAIANTTINSFPLQESRINVICLRRE